LVAVAGNDSRVARAALIARPCLTARAPRDSIDVAIAPAPGSKMKCNLCPSNKDYCNFGAGARQDFKVVCESSGAGQIRDRNASPKRRCRRRRGLFRGINGGTIGVAESPHQSLDSASAECREGENRRDQCLRSDLGGKTNYLKISFQNNSLRRKPDDG
jgi:hypothetical protein